MKTTEGKNGRSITEDLKTDGTGSYYLKSKNAVVWSIRHYRFTDEGDVWTKERGFGFNGKADRKPEGYCKSFMRNWLAG